MGESNSVLTRFFSQSMLQDCLSQETPSIELMQRIVRKYHISIDAETTNEKVISDIYHYVGKSYRNEYFYKNTLLNKLIINVHRVNTTTALTEVPIAKSKADFIMINGKAVVYEIKTELDSFDRLENQILFFLGLLVFQKNMILIILKSTQFFELKNGMISLNQ